MTVGEICNRDMVFVRREDTTAEAARSMRQHHIGDPAKPITHEQAREKQKRR